jgi:diacylglycerol kinase family enzyme
VRYSRAREVTIDTVDAAGVALDLDGEHAQGGRLRFSVRPGLLHLLRA